MRPPDAEWLRSAFAAIVTGEDYAGGAACLVGVYAAVRGIDDDLARSELYAAAQVRRAAGPGRDLGDDGLRRAYLRQLGGRDLAADVEDKVIMSGGVLPGGFWRPLASIDEDVARVQLVENVVTGDLGLVREVHGEPARSAFVGPVYPKGAAT